MPSTTHHRRHITEMVRTVSACRQQSELLHVGTIVAGFTTSSPRIAELISAFAFHCFAPSSSVFPTAMALAGLKCARACKRTWCTNWGVQFQPVRMFQFEHPGVSLYRCGKVLRGSKAVSVNDAAVKRRCLVYRGVAKKGGGAVCRADTVTRCGGACFSSSASHDGILSPAATPNPTLSAH